MGGERRDCQSVIVWRAAERGGRAWGARRVRGGGVKASAFAKGGSERDLGERCGGEARGARARALFLCVFFIYLFCFIIYLFICSILYSSSFYLLSSV